MENNNQQAQYSNNQQAQPNYNQAAYQQPTYNQQPMYNQAPIAPETKKPRSAYVAGILHLFFGLLGLGYYYRGMDEKAKYCWIMLIVGAVLTFMFGIGVIIIAVCQIINIVEAIKLFSGQVTKDAYGRTLYQEF